MMRFHWSIDRHPVIWRHQMLLMKFGQQWLDLCKNIFELPGNWPTLKQNRKLFSRQHEHYNREACLDHLSFCFRHNMGAPAFVNRYTNKRPAIAYPGLLSITLHHVVINSFSGHLMRNTLWSISSDHPLLSSIRHGITFQLIQESF